MILRDTFSDKQQNENARISPDLLQFYSVVTILYVFRRNIIKWVWFYYHERKETSHEMTSSIRTWNIETTCTAPKKPSEFQLQNLSINFPWIFEQTVQFKIWLRQLTLTSRQIQVISNTRMLLCKSGMKMKPWDYAHVILMIHHIYIRTWLRSTFIWFDL